MLLNLSLINDSPPPEPDGAARGAGSAFGGRSPTDGGGREPDLSSCAFNYMLLAGLASPGRRGEARRHDQAAQYHPLPKKPRGGEGGEEGWGAPSGQRGVQFSRRVDEGRGGRLSIIPQHCDRPSRGGGRLLS